MAPETDGFCVACQECLCSGDCDYCRACQAELNAYYDELAESRGFEIEVDHA